MTKPEFTRRVLEAEATLYHLSKSILQNDEDCADAVQETICIAYDKLPGLREEEFFKSWLCRILLNECYRICRAGKKTVPLEDYMLTDAAPAPREPSELAEAVWALPQALRLPVVLHYVEGFQIEEIAAILKVPKGTVKSRLFRARAALKTALSDEEGFCHESQ